MSRTKSFSSLSLALLALLCFQAQTLSLFDGHSLRNTILNAHASTSGVIEIQRDDYDSDSRFYVEADLSYYPASSSIGSKLTEKSPNATKAAATAKMMVSIVNSDTMVAADDCLSFSQYDCSQYSRCSQSEIENQIEYLSFTALTKAAKGDLYLDYDYWSIPSSNSFAIAQSCWSNGIASVGHDRYGVIGLGTAGNAKDDFTKDKMFSIYMKSDLSGGKLLFKNHTSTYANSSEPINTFYMNSTWQIPLYRGASIQIEDSGASLSYYSLMFDINTDVIGLPYSAYVNFVNAFVEKTGARCSFDHYRPVCEHLNKVEYFPDIIISFTKYKLRIPSAIYASVIKEASSFYFNFKATDPTLSGQSYVAPSFANAVILGTHFMKYYFTVFDASTNLNIVYLYGSKKAEIPPKSNNALWIVVGAVIAVFIISMCCWYAKKQKNTSTTTTTLNNTNISYTAPSIYNQQGGFYSDRTAGFTQSQAKQ